VAVAAVAFLSQTDGGSERLEHAFAGETETAPVSVKPMVAEVTPKPTPAEPAVSVAQAKAETERLTARVRDLTADRDRLNARLATLERQLADVTGSIAPRSAPPAPVTALAPVTAPAKAAASAASVGPTLNTKPAVLVPAMPRQIAAIARPSREPPRIIEPLAMPATRDITTHWSDASHPAAPAEHAAAVAVPLPPVRPMRVAAVRKRTPPPQSSLPGLGLDVGGSLSPGRLRSQWTEVKANFGPLLAGLHPVIGRDGRFGHLPYRLLIGPVPNEEAAARLCANLTAGGVECHPTPFAGQQLAQY
jgi:hypothetical protein